MSQKYVLSGAVEIVREPPHKEGLSYSNGEEDVHFSFARIDWRRSSGVACVWLIGAHHLVLECPDEEENDGKTGVEEAGVVAFLGESQSQQNGEDDANELVAGKGEELKGVEVGLNVEDVDGGQLYAHLHDDPGESL